MAPSDTSQVGSVMPHLQDGEKQGAPKVGNGSSFSSSCILTLNHKAPFFSERIDQVPYKTGKDKECGMANLHIPNLVFYGEAAELCMKTCPTSGNMGKMSAFLALLPHYVTSSMFMNLN